MLKKVLKDMLPGIITFLVVIVLFVVLLNFIYIPTSSMEPTIRANSLCISFRLPYLAKTQHRVGRGDIVVFYSSESQKALCKRVIGIAGDNISFRDGYVYVNGEKADEPYVAEEGKTFCGSEFHVPDGCMFVMGDNRQHSLDSREMKMPYIKTSSLISKILFSIPLPEKEGETHE